MRRCTERRHRRCPRSSRSGPRTRPPTPVRRRRAGLRATAHGHLQLVPAGLARDAVGVLASEVQLVLPGPVGLAVGLGPLGAGPLLVVAAAFGVQAPAPRRDDWGLLSGAREA